jgi:hypothetical protein
MGLFSSLFGDNSGSKAAAKVSEANLAWQKDMAAKDQAARDAVLTGLQPGMDYANQMDRTIIDQSLQDAGTARERGNTLWNQYTQDVMPVNHQFYTEALDYGNAADQERAAGVATSDVRQQYATQKGINERNLASMGVNPNSGRFASADRAAELAAMAAAAGGATKARTTARDTGIQLRKDATQIGNGMLTNTTQQQQLSLSGNQLAGNLTGNAVTRGLAAGNFKVGGTANAMNAVSNAAGNTASSLQSTNTTGLVPGLMGLAASTLTAPSTSWIGKKLS